MLNDRELSDLRTRAKLADQTMSEWIRQRITTWMAVECLECGDKVSGPNVQPGETLCAACKHEAAKPLRLGGSPC